MPNTPPDEGNLVAQQTGDQPKALKPALASMTLLVAAVIVHDKATNRIVLLQRGGNAKFAQGMWDLPVGKSEPGEPITETAVRELYEGDRPHAHEWTGEPDNREPRKHAQVCWVDVGAIPENFVDTTSSALHRYLEGGPEVSLDGWQQSAGLLPRERQAGHGWDCFVPRHRDRGRGA